MESNALLQLSQRLGEDFNQVIDLILACEGRLVIGGIGKSGLIGKKMVATFASTGIPSFFFTSNRSLPRRFRYVKTN